MKNKNFLKTDIKSKNAFKMLINLFFAVFVIGIFLFSYPCKSYAAPITGAKLIELSNRERISRGIKPLTIDPNLYFAAVQKNEDMFKYQYFEHISPQGKTPWIFILSAHYFYLKAGENLAMDFRTSEGVHKAWMESPSHKANILNPDFEDIAISVIKGNFEGRETTIVVEMFGKKNNTWSKPINMLVIKISNFILGF